MNKTDGTSQLELTYLQVRRYAPARLPTRWLWDTEEGNSRPDTDKSMQYTRNIYNIHTKYQCSVRVEYTHCTTKCHTVQSHQEKEGSVSAQTRPYTESAVVYRREESNLH